MTSRRNDNSESEPEGRARFNEAIPDGAALESPAAERNKRPILERLRELLPEHGVVLEIASGTGQHATFFAAALPTLIWQPTDPDATLRQSIRGRTAAAALANIRAPLELDTTARVWPVERADAVVCINMIHIAPWAATLGLFAGAESLLDAGAPLVLYGPFMREGRHTAPSNAAFDASLKARDSSWGVRDLETVGEVAARHGFDLERVFEMPANNLLVAYRRR
jgi:hypothetical protein